jgi:hypothetical protein
VAIVQVLLSVLILFVLRSTAKKQGFTLDRCRYDRDVQERSVQELVDWAIDNVVSSNIYEFIVPLMRLVPLLKNEHFKEEAEWRLISRPILADHPQFDYRTGQSLIIPYFRIALSNKKNKKEIKKNYCRALSHMDLAENAVTMLGYSCGYMNLSVSRSSIPYRNW